MNRKRLFGTEPVHFDTTIAGFSPRQREAVRLAESGKTKFLLYGGALGGGKSYFLRWYAIRRLMSLRRKYGVEGAVAMLACEDYPSLKDRQIQKVSKEFPPWLGDGYKDHGDFGRCFILSGKWGGGVLVFRNLDDASKYASSEFALICVDELTKNKYHVFTDLRMRLRWPGVPDHECQFVGGTNPGGVGHGWVKQLWMDRAFGPEWISPVDFRPSFAYVPSKAQDNPHLDAAYWTSLQTLPLTLRKAFLDGDWNIFIGQAFPEFSRARHVIAPIQVPEYAPITMTMDWGFGKPFSIGWWWKDGDGRVYRFAEWYGWNGTADQGLRLADSALADGVVEREKAMGIFDSRRVVHLAGPDCFSKRPDVKGGGQGDSTKDVFASKGIKLLAADPDRKVKIRQFHEWLKVPEDGSLPRLVVYDTCTQFIRTITNLIMDKDNVEDVDTDGEDHVYDEACHIVMAKDRSVFKSENLEACAA